jgi:thiamine-phosphate pyrophosphorylase
MRPDDARARLAEARLCLLLTRRLCRRPPLEVLAAAIDGGCGLVQIREPDSGDGALVAWVRDALRLTNERGVPLVVNDRADVAVIAGADGVHLGADDIRPDDVRAAFGRDLLVGLSTHGASDVVAARSLSVDYCGLGPVYDTATKGLPGRGLELLRAALPHASVPAFAIGGITVERIPALRAAGATRFAVSNAICSAADPCAVARAFSAL